MASESDFERHRERPFRAIPEVPTPHGGIDLPISRPEFAGAERKFLEAIQEYRRASGRLFPTWGEVLEVARGLACRKPGGPSPGR